MHQRRYRKTIFFGGHAPETPLESLRTYPYRLSYMYALMTSERLSSLALLHIHRGKDVNVEAVLDTFAVAKNRKLYFI